MPWGRARYEDPQDVAAIAWAEKNMGDYKLKTDGNYVVPENLVINADKKRRQMVLLEESVHSIKMGFNERFLACRDLKRRIKDAVEKDSTRIGEINAELGIKEKVTKLQLLPEEFPEKREEVDNDALVKFEEEQKKAVEAAKKAAGGGLGGLGGGGGKKAAVAEEEEEEEEEEDGSNDTKERQGLDVSSMSALEKAELVAKHQRLYFEKQQINDRIDKRIKAFDEATLNNKTY